MVPLNIPPQVRQACQSILLRVTALPEEGAATGRSLAFTSSLPGEGVSTLALLTATTAEEASDQRILLIDGHLSRPSHHARFDIELSPGLIDILANPELLNKKITRDVSGNLSVLSAGQAPSSFRWSGEAIEHFAALVKTCQNEFDIVILDMPPVSAADMPLPLLAHLDAVVLVVEAERVPIDVARQASKQLTMAGAKLLGAVYNQRPSYLADRLPWS